MAQIAPLGKTIVPTPGTPVPVANLGSLLGADVGNQRVHAFIVQALPTNTGRIYIGDTTLNKSTFVGVMGMLPTPTSNFLPSFNVAITAAANGLRLDTLRIDADQPNDGVIVTPLVW